jgi:hypothetical protein
VRALAQATPALGVVARDLGAIVEVRVHSTVVRFTPPRTLPKIRLGGAVVPAGIAYEAEFHRPRREAAAGEDRRATVDLEIAIEIATGAHEAILYTDGTGLLVSVLVDGEPVPGQERRAPPRREVLRSPIRSEVHS